MITIPTRKPFNASDAGDLLGEATFETKDVTNRNRSAADSIKQTRKKLGILTIAKATEKNRKKNGLKRKRGKKFISESSKNDQSRKEEGFIEKFKKNKKGPFGKAHIIETNSFEIVGPHFEGKDNRKELKGFSSYLVGRGFMFNGSPVNHLFIVTDAKYPGDPNAIVISFGKLANGNLGRLGDGSAQPSEDAKDTHQKDKIFWESLRNASGRLPVSPIDARSLVVRQLAGSLKENQRYRLDGVNSNSAMVAIARRSLSETSKTPNFDFLTQDSPGSVLFHKIEFRGGP